MEQIQDLAINLLFLAIGWLIGMLDEAIQQARHNRRP